MEAQAANDQRLSQNDLSAREAKVASKTYGKFIVALAVGFVLLMALLAASGTKLIDITALHFKADASQQSEPTKSPQEDDTSK